MSKKSKEIPSECLRAQSIPSTSSSDVQMLSENSISTVQSILDVGNYVNMKDTIDDNLKYRLLASP